MAGKPTTRQILQSLVFAKTNRRCWYCGGDLAFENIPLSSAQTAATIDHVLPRSAGGTDNLTNLVPACRRCNSSKGLKSLDDFRLSRSEYYPVIQALRRAIVAAERIHGELPEQNSKQETLYRAITESLIAYTELSPPFVFYGERAVES